MIGGLGMLEGLNLLEMYLNVLRGLRRNFIKPLSQSSRTLSNLSQAKWT